MPYRFLTVYALLALGCAGFLLSPIFVQTANAQSNNSSLETQIVSQLENIEGRIDKVNDEIKNIRAQNIALSSEIARLQAEEDHLKKKLKSHITGLNEAARTVARIERMPLQALTFSDDLRKAHMRQFAITQGRRSLNNQIDEQNIALEELKDLQFKREEALAKVMQLEERHDDRKKHLKKLFDGQLKLLELNDSEKAALVKEAHQMKEAKALQDLLALRKSATYKISRVSENYGKLPTQGHITLKFAEKNSVGIESRGVTIEAMAGADVVALKDGRVIYNGPFRDYGQIIILEHAEGLHSLYSGAEKSDLALGDFVRAGQKISVMPATENPKFYIELRKDGKAVNPSILFLAQK